MLIILVFAQSLWAMQVSKMFMGLFLSTEVAYFTYIYAKVGKEHYQEVTSHAMTACLLGRFVAGVTGQFLLSSRLINYDQLNYLAISGTNSRCQSFRKEACSTEVIDCLPSIVETYSLLDKRDTLSWSKK